MEQSTADTRVEEKVVQPSSPSSPSSSSSSTSASPVPAIKLQRKCPSGWTLSNNRGTNNSVSKLRRGGRVKLKLRSWMAEPLVVKEGDASLRLATDLPRFNWLELKLNQKQDGPNDEPIVRSATNNDDLPIVPLKVRILEKSANMHRETPASIADKKSDHSKVAQHIKVEESSESTCTSRWPLKKRLIRQENQVSPDTSPVVSPVISPVKQKPNLPEVSVLNLTKFAQDEIQTDLQLSPPAQRGPVIMRNVLPPTPPASSAPPELIAVDADQDKPLDLSKRCVIKEPTPPTPPTPFIPPSKLREDKAEVEIIAMTTRISKPARPTTVGFQPLRQRFAHNPAEIHRIHRHEKEIAAKPIREYTIQRVPLIRPQETSFPDWSRNVAIGFRPYTDRQRPSGPILPTIPTAAVATAAPTSRPFVLPPLRPLPHHWNSLVAQQQHNVVIRPEVQLHPIVGTAHPSTGFIPGPRLFHPQQVTATTTKKPQATVSHSGTTLPPDWSLRSCVVCSRRADFRCAGCHGNAYCSTLCQARDWPSHSQLCQRNS